MKILHLLKHCVAGNGHVHVAVDLACTQADAGHEVMLASSGGTYDSLLRAHGVKIATIPQLSSARAAPRGAAVLLDVARQFRPDLIHAHMMSSAVIGFGISKIIRTPMVTTMHNSFEKHSLLMRLGKVVVAVSEAERQLLLSRRYPADKVTTVVNGTDGSPRETHLVDGQISTLARPCIATLCGLHPRKAVGDVVAAFAEVVAEFPHWHLNIIGWGPDREQLEVRVEELELADSIHFLGSTRTPRLLLEQADIFA